MEGLFAGGHTCACAQSMCVRGTGQKQERSDHTCSPAWAAHTGAPPLWAPAHHRLQEARAFLGLKRQGFGPGAQGGGSSVLGMEILSLPS